MVSQEPITKPSCSWSLKSSKCRRKIPSVRALQSLELGKGALLVSLGLNSVAEYHGSFAGILCTGIMGGAVVPLIIGRIGDLFGLRAGMAFLYVTFGCVLSVGFWAKPLITNATVRARKAVPEPAL